MNSTVEEFTRGQIREGLARLPEAWRDKFKLMYATPTDTRHRKPAAVEKIKASDINEVVDSMDAEKLDWALTQVENSLEKLAPAG